MWRSGVGVVLLVLWCWSCDAVVLWCCGAVVLVFFSCCCGCVAFSCPVLLRWSVYCVSAGFVASWHRFAFRWLFWINVLPCCSLCLVLYYFALCFVLVLICV